MVKHASASKVTVSLRCIPSPYGVDDEQRGRVELSVSDDGGGFDPGAVPPYHLGLGIIRERAEAVGATVEIRSWPDRGTQILVVWEGSEGRGTEDEGRGAIASGQA